MAYFAVLLLVVSFTRLPTLFNPIFSPDEAIFANVARAILDDGELYGSIIDHKPPLIFYPPRLDPAAESGFYHPIQNRY